MKNKKIENLLEMAQLLHGVDRLSKNVSDLDPDLTDIMECVSDNALAMAKESMVIVMDEV